MHYIFWWNRWGWDPGPSSPFESPFSVFFFCYQGRRYSSFHQCSRTSWMSSLYQFYVPSNSSGLFTSQFLSLGFPLYFWFWFWFWLPTVIYTIYAKLIFWSDFSFLLIYSFIQEFFAEGSRLMKILGLLSFKFQNASERLYHTSKLALFFVLPFCWLVFAFLGLCSN